MRYFLPLLVLTAACSPEQQTRETASVCGLEGNDNVRYSSVLIPEAEVDCFHSVLADFPVDISTMEHQAGFTFESLEVPDEDVWRTPMGMVASGGYALLQYDWGNFDVPLFQGDEPKGWQVYAYVISSSEWSNWDSEHFRYEFEMHQATDPSISAALLLHLAAGGDESHSLARQLLESMANSSDTDQAARTRLLLEAHTLTHP